MAERLAVVSVACWAAKLVVAKVVLKADWLELRLVVLSDACLVVLSVDSLVCK